MKTNKSVSMAFAIFAGMVAGSLVALRVEKSILWLLIGALVGGIVGYFAVNPLNVLKGIAHGWNAGVAYFKSQDFRAGLSEQMSISWKRVIRKVLIILAFLVAFLSWLLVCLKFSSLLSRYGIAAQLDDRGHLILTLYMAAIMFGESIYLWFHNVKISSDDWPEPKPNLMSMDWPDELTRKICRKDHSFIFSCFFFTSPGFAFLFGLFLLQIFILACWLLLFLTKNIGKGILIAVSHTFRFIHSEERVQASAYSIVGTATMWWIQASVPVILVGAALGAVLGVLTFRFVTARFVKPATS